jgi:hypothetical protein
VVYILLLFEKPIKHCDICHPPDMSKDALTQFSLSWYTSRIDWNVLKCNKGMRFILCRYIL